MLNFGLATLNKHEDIAFSTSVLFSNLAKKSTVDVEKFKQWFDKTYITTEDLPAKMKQGLFQSAMKRSEFTDFNDFFNDVLKNKTSKNKKQYNAITNGGLNIRIPHDTVNHDIKEKHNLKADEWIKLLDNIDNVKTAILSRHKSRYDGTSVLLKIKNGNDTYGVVIEIFKKNNPLISTAFKDNEASVDNWIKNEAIPSGTQTTFSDTRLTDIIMHFSPNFKPKTYNQSQNIKDDVRFQSNKESIEKTVQDKFGCSVDELTENIKQDVINALADNNISDSEFNIQDIRLYGSYSKGTNKQSSDLDFIVQYDGSMKEDSAFNILHDVINTIEDKNGNKVTVDINPINVNESGTIDEHVAYMNSLDNNDNVYYQSAYHGTPHRFDEFSTEHIGSGEGAQAHGNKDISEGYRKSLSDDNFDNEKYFYNGKEITDRNKKAILSTIVDNGKDKVISTREKNIEKYKYSQEEYKQKNEELDWIKSLDENKIEKKTDKGQLFEVDIPENDVLLDEDLPLSEQPQKVQEALKTIAEKTEYRFFIEDWINRNLTGQEIYNELAMHMNIDNRMAYYPEERFNPFEKASKLFNEYGIKGIKYNGQQDGECYVIFDDKAVQVLKTYYQGINNNAVDLTDDFDKTPTIEEVKSYINELVESGKKFATLSPEWLVDVRGGKRVTNKILNAGNYKGLYKKSKNRHNKYIMSLEKLLANAEYIGEKENTKQDKKPNVEKYHYFKTNVKIGDKVYEIIFDTEEYKNDNKKSTSVGYAKRNSKRTEVDINSSPSANVLRSVKSLGEDTNSITDNSNNINPQTVHLYNISEYKGNSYYQDSNDESTKQILSTENIEQKKNDLENKLTELTWSDSNEDNSSMIESISQDIETLERFLEKGVAELCKKYNIKITPDTVMTHYEFGKKHPKTSSAGKIDIVYLPPYPKVKKDEVGDFIKNKIRWYFNKL